MRGAIRSAALLLLFVGMSGAAAAQPPRDAMRVTVLDQSGATIPAAHAQPVDPPGATQERSTDERGGRSLPHPALGPRGFPDSSP
jgi:hypothetical protein